MRRQICRVLTALACLAGFSGPTLAQDNLACNPGSFLSFFTVGNQIPTGNFGEICITLTDSTHATVFAETLNGYEMFGAGAFALNVNSTGFSIVGGNPGISTNGTTPTAAIAFPGGTEDGLGRYDLSISLFDGPSDGATFMSFTLLNTAGTWANVSSVLKGNGVGPAPGYDAAMQIAANCPGEDCAGAGFAAELYSNGRIIPQPAPEPGILSLLGVGLLAWGLPALRRRKA